MDERVATDPAPLAALVRDEKDLHLHGRELTDPGGRRGVEDLAVRAGGDLIRRTAHLGAGHSL